MIIAAPSWHPADAGLYQWVRTGPVRPLPDELAEQLHDSAPGEEAATDAQVAAFMAAHTTASRPDILQGRIKGLANKIESGALRA